MRLKVLIWRHHPGDLLGDAIDFVTHGVAQHAGFLDVDGTVVEAYWPKLRRRALVPGEAQFLSPFLIRGLEPQFDGFISKQLALDLQHPPEYSGWDLIRFLFNVPSQNENSTFCSRYVQHTLMRVIPHDCWPLIRCQDNDWVSPRDLFISNMLLECNLND